MSLLAVMENASNNDGSAMVMMTAATGPTKSNVRRQPVNRARNSHAPMVTVYPHVGVAMETWIVPMVVMNWYVLSIYCINMTTHDINNHTYVYNVRNSNKTDRGVNTFLL